MCINIAWFSLLRAFSSYICHLRSENEHLCYPVYTTFVVCQIELVNQCCLTFHFDYENASFVMYDTFGSCRTI